MKGDNIIEAHCAVCGKNITLADINMQYTSRDENGKLIHLNHDKVVQQELQDKKLMDTVVDILTHVLHKNISSSDGINEYIHFVSLKTKIDFPILTKHVRSFCVANKYSDKEKD